MSMPKRSDEEERFDIKVGTRLKVLREDNQLSKKTIADAVGCSTNHYRRVEKGEASLSAYQYSIICNYYNVSPNKIYGRTELNGAEYGLELVRIINNMSREQKYLLMEIAKNVAGFKCTPIKKDDKKVGF